jgi:hypothetical protein
MNEGANSWGERDAVDRWIKSVGVMVKEEEFYLLARMVSEPRMALQADISERRLQLATKIREAEAAKEKYSESGDARYTEACVRLNAFLEGVQDHGRYPVKAKITIEEEGLQTVVFHLDEFQMEQTRDFIHDYDSDGKKINIRENPANPGVMVHIRGRQVKP